ncbi:hypothetical protein ACTMU2_35000 [Cupriavidus basilensis]
MPGRLGVYLVRSLRPLVRRGTYAAWMPGTCVARPVRMRCTSASLAPVPQHEPQGRRQQQYNCKQRKRPGAGIPRHGGNTINQ